MAQFFRSFEKKFGLLPKKNLDWKPGRNAKNMKAMLYESAEPCDFNATTQAEQNEAKKQLTPYPYNTSKRYSNMSALFASNTRVCERLVADTMPLGWLQHCQGPRRRLGQQGPCPATRGLTTGTGREPDAPVAPWWWSLRRCVSGRV